jgi:hypothetical protein
MSAIARPVHPCVMSLTEASRGAELSTWAHICGRPTLVTACASTLNVYSYNSDEQDKLRLEHSFGNLAGSIIYLEALSCSDSLLVGFAGQPRLSVLRISSATSNLLQADALIDLTSALQDASFGAVGEQQDMIVCQMQQTPSITSVACVLGGGVAVVLVDLHRQNNVWEAKEPYVMPLATIPLPNTSVPADTTATISTGWGEIISCTFLSCYLEPVLLLLHTHPGGRTASGRLGCGQGACQQGLLVTALSVSVAHSRTARLWSTVVSADCFLVDSSRKKNSLIVVVGVNTLILMDASGIVHQVMAVNGWARSTCTSNLIAALKPNPLIKLAVNLDGCSIAWLSHHAAVVALRTGQLYILQQTNKDTWMLLPTGQVLGAIGHVAHLTTLRLNDSTPSWINKLDVSDPTAKLDVGLLFAGSRLGSSLLLGYALDSVQISLVEDIIIKQDVIKEEVFGAKVESQSNGTIVDDEFDLILRTEEEALYAPTESQLSQADIVSLSDGEEEINGNNTSNRKLLAKFSTVRVLTPIDSLVNLGPLGPSCEGPLSRAPAFFKDEEADVVSKNTNHAAFGSSAYVFPSGFGSSGGIALATVPGRDDRMILGEQDCLNVDCIYSLSEFVMLGMSRKEGGGIKVLRVKQPEHRNDLYVLDEINVEDFSTAKPVKKRPKRNNKPANADIFKSVADIFKSTILSAGEFESGSSLLLVSTPDDSVHYVLVVLKKAGEFFSLEAELGLESNGASLLKVSPFVKRKLHGEDAISFCCVWSSGSASVVTLTTDGTLSSYTIENETLEMNVDSKDIDDDEQAVYEYYESTKVVAVDVFRGRRYLFTSQLPIEAEADSMNVTLVSNGDRTTNAQFDDDDKELYVTPSERDGLDRDKQTLFTPSTRVGDISDDATFAAVCRQSGKLEIYSVDDVAPTLQWVAFGCGQGSTSLVHSPDEFNDTRRPRSHMICADEIRFFSCGATCKKESSSLASFCMALKNTAGDLELYIASRSTPRGCPLSFHRAQTRSVARPSQEQQRHHTKLVRKRLAEKDYGMDALSFSHHRLHRFSGISGQDGLFFAGNRPAWLVAERGRPSLIFHRTRHAAPAGGTLRPVNGFCSGLLNAVSGVGGFLTLHERVGNVGSQRLTAFHGISNVFESHGLLCGNSGLCVEKIPMGVTVRSIAFIDDPSISSSDHPLYAVLVSREVEGDQHTLNNDGLTEEERRRYHDEKEAEKIKKQVEADLGGFDMDSEWLEEIEREDCFRVDMDLGGATPVQSQTFSLWIVDAANKWMVVDSYEFEKFEHVLSVNVLHLTEFPEVPGRAFDTVPEEIDVSALSNRLFIAVGTGVIDHNGEDVSSKGRVMLFEATRSQGVLAASQLVDLSLTYEKHIFHGPVQTLQGLSVEGKNRLVVGAGADINIEQWGNGKLTQVGFFRATMHILDIRLFKNFLLLSDAYDSIHFLVWRESDKSLTLLAKDYDPIVVYATGLMSRGQAITFICHDDRENLQFFQYAPGEAASRGGNKLVCRADFHLGAQTTSFASYFCHSSLLVHSATATSTRMALKQQDNYHGRSDDDQKIGALFGTGDGGLGTIVPVSEPVYWRLTALQSIMVNALESDASLSQRAWRLYRRTAVRGGCRSNDRKKGVIDGDLIMRYVDLAKVEQEDLASAIGSTVDLIVDNLLELHCNSMIM